MGQAQSVVELPQSQFRIRFTRARGLAALFEQPENTYQWSGYGTLRVEQGGVRLLATRRRLIGIPHAEAHFVPSREISNVYREADGVRIEFREHGRPTYLNFWAASPTEAAKMVERLPTARTVEVEDAPPFVHRPRRRDSRVAWLAALVVGLALLAFGTWALLKRSPQQDEAEALPAGAAIQLPSTGPALSLSPEELNVLQADLARFTNRSLALQAQFDSAFKALQEGNLSQPNFADGVERWLLPQWVSVEQSLREKTYAPGSPREELRATLIAVTTNWRVGLESYVSGLRRQDARAVQRAFAYIGAAEESQRDVMRMMAP